MHKWSERNITTLLMLGTFTKPSWLTGGVPLAGRWSDITKALEVCCCARNLIALWSAVSASVSSAFLISEDYIVKRTLSLNTNNNNNNNKRAMSYCKN